MASYDAALPSLLQDTASPSIAADAEAAAAAAAAAVVDFAAVADLNRWTIASLFSYINLRCTLFRSLLSLSLFIIRYDNIGFNELNVEIEDDESVCV